MKVLLVKWKAYGQEFLKGSLEEAGFTVDEIFYDAEREGVAEDCSFLPPLCEKLTKNHYQFVISFNYFPVISTACERKKVKYVAWTVDSPLYTLYTRSVFNSCNYIFVFDKSSLTRLKEMGVRHVWYLPLAADAAYFEEICAKETGHRYASEVSFVGSLYTDKSAFGLLGNQKDYFQGFMEGLVEAQRKLWGCSLVEEVLDECWSQQLKKMLQPVNDKEFIADNSMVFANSCLLVEVTARERKEYLAAAGGLAAVDVYTGSDTTGISVRNRGRVDYRTKMPLVFRNSKINLNITLRSIQQGISLRVWDILACGGFLLTNYQPELEEFFEIGKDLECFFNKEDMLAKIEYYLAHEEERAEIARRGYEKVRSMHGYKQRLMEIQEKINGKDTSLPLE